MASEGGGGKENVLNEDLEWGVQAPAALKMP
jgi:hypothetical protein